MSPTLSIPGPDVTLITERDWQSEVIEIAGAGGWMHYHTHDSRKSARGFPDLVFVRERVVYAELKSETGKPSDDQVRWLHALAAAGQEVYLWRPRDRATVDRTLLTPRGAWRPPTFEEITAAIVANGGG